MSHRYFFHYFYKYKNKLNLFQIVSVLAFKKVKKVVFYAELLEFQAELLDVNSDPHFRCGSGSESRVSKNVDPMRIQIRNPGYVFLGI